MLFVARLRNALVQLAAQTTQQLSDNIGVFCMALNWKSICTDGIRLIPLCFLGHIQEGKSRYVLSCITTA